MSRRTIKKIQNQIEREETKGGEENITNEEY
jgi:hypothetical protein